MRSKYTNQFHRQIKHFSDTFYLSSFDEEKTQSKTLVDEMSALKSHVETIQQNFVSQSELRKNAEFRLALLQSQLTKLEKRNRRLSDELRRCMENARQQQGRLNDDCDLNNSNSFIIEFQFFGTFSKKKISKNPEKKFQGEKLNFQQKNSL